MPFLNSQNNKAIKNWICELCGLEQSSQSVPEKGQCLKSLSGIHNWILNPKVTHHEPPKSDNNIKPVVIKNSSNILLTSIILAVAIAIIIIFVYFKIASFFGVFELSRSISSSTIAQAITNVNELVTVKGYFETVVRLEETSDWHIPGRYRKLLLTFDGYITCGFDMNKTNVKVKEPNNVTVYLPHAKVIDAVADLGSINEYDSQTGLLTSNLSFEDKIKLVNQRREEIKTEAVEKWHLIKQAEHNANIILKELIQAVNVDVKDLAVNIIFTDDEKLLRVPENVNYSGEPVSSVALPDK